MKLFRENPTMPYTILLQGRIEEEPMKLWIKNHSKSKVIISVWEDEDLSKFKFPKNWVIVVNQYPLIRFRIQGNLDYQIITTLHGLRKVETDWVIKMRCDEYWSNIDKIYDKMIQNPEKIITGSMFFRKWGIYNKFHPSDKIMGGTLDNVIGMFESTLHNLEIKLWEEGTNPESQLGLGYVMLKEPNLEVNNLVLRNEKKKSEFTEEDKIRVISNGLSIVSKETIDIIMDDFRKNNIIDINWKSLGKRIVYCKDILLECIKATELDDVELIDDKPYMRKWFDIIDINELKPYIATRNFGKPGRGRVWYRSNFVNEKEECLTNINE